MTIELYSNSSPANYVNKSISLVSTLTGTLREPSSIVDPTITIERGSPIGFNYAHITDFNRYYFVTGVSSEHNGLIAISMHVDVLMTYKTEIAAATGVVKRQENKYNLYLDDGIFKSYQNTKHKLITFPNSFTDFSFILTLAGNSPSS